VVEDCAGIVEKCTTMSPTTRHMNVARGQISLNAAENVGTKSPICACVNVKTDG
jgi:hypothetical protein